MKRYVSTLLLLITAAALAYGIVQLLSLRFELSDVYPEYSSLRSDPLGAMVLFESIGTIPGVATRRDFSTSNVMPDGKETTMLFLALHKEEWRLLPEDTFAEINKFVASGGRLVISLYPDSANPRLPIPLPTPEPLDPNQKPKATPYRDRWRAELEIVNLRQGADGVYEPVRVNNVSGQRFPDSIDWHSGIVFTKLNPEWKPIYMRGTDPVVIERTLARGSVVIATDSFFLSNEAMLKDRHSALLAWLMGPNRHVVFDEAHLGVTESRGMATLMRSYRLEWLIASLILLAGLFIWKNSSSLIPPYVEVDAQQYVIGKDAASGFINLLRRNVPRADLLGACLSEWKKAIPLSGKRAEERIQQVEAVFNAENSLAVKQRDPIRAYRAIAEILQTHNSKVLK